MLDLSSGDLSKVSIPSNSFSNSKEERDVKDYN
jgi:hypothetical protein